MENGVFSFLNSRIPNWVMSISRIEYRAWHFGNFIDHWPLFAVIALQAWTRPVTPNFWLCAHVLSLQKKIVCCFVFRLLPYLS